MPRKKKDPDREDTEKQKGVVLQDVQSQTISTQQVEQIMQQLLQQFGSQTQGSTNQQHQTESSTPSGSLIQKPQTKTPSTKQTLESYAREYSQKKLPEKTFSQTLSQQNLALLPLSKKEYDSQFDPSQMIKCGKIVRIVASSSSKAIVQVQTQPIDMPYFHKTDRVRNIVQVEPEFYHKNPNQVALNIFPPGWYFKPTDFRKTREYYELILVHSGSCNISRKNDDPKDKSVITHSTLQILQVLTPSQWGQDLNKQKFFGINYEPEGYNYWDYVDAWSNVFWDQNKSFKHTWFIYFKTKTKYQFPHWFVHWWTFFGPVPEILPPTVLQAFELFKQKFNIGEDSFPIDLHYFSKLSVSWIFCWNFRFSPKIEGSTLLPVLQRLPSVKWWSKFELKRIDVDAINRWFKQNAQYLCMTEQSKFLNQKSRVQSILASTTDKTSLINQLGSMLQILQQQEQPSSSQQTSSSTASENQEDEEDQFIVDLSED